jgi:hypothetical protein
MMDKVNVLAVCLPIKRRVILTDRTQGNGNFLLGYCHAAALEWNKIQM